MRRLLVGRLLAAPLVLLAVSTLTFVLMRTVPGGPFDVEKPLPPAIKANIEAKYRLNDPFWLQYVSYVGGVLRGDLGPSYKYVNRSVTDIVRATLPVSAALGALALLVSLILGLIFGTLAGAFSGTWVDRTALFLATLGIALPGFLLGAVVILVFAHNLRIFPPALWEGARYTILPAVTLGIGPAAYLARLVRSGILETMHQDFVRTAKAKGLHPVRVMLFHVLGNALTPVLSVLGPLTAAFVTGSFVVEYLFSIPGMGKYFVDSVANRDYPLIMGVTLVYGVILYAANVVVDILYAWADPRVGRE
ncbi:MAG: ABC transporter permease [Nitrospirae bacterium]|nr:ABC transporter permease [Nitrospirota bacterium]MBI3393686.1 ABC transporter permease [Nitrospirota bacterium]